MVNFEKGKWYKGEKNDFYIKFSHLETKEGYNAIYCLEDFRGNVYSKKLRYCWANSEFERFALNNPVTIEELRKFLPEGHPDLQLNNIYELW